MHKFVESILEYFGVIIFFQLTSFYSPCFQDHGFQSPGFWSQDLGPCFRYAYQMPK